ncbi:MAG: hypothetical protein OEX19_00540 [Gammaproteobacteria bacterium]|nr:hypothetical protein [Gammaproteobacteria bacterium]
MNDRYTVKTITKAEMLRQLEAIPDNGKIYIQIDKNDYEKVQRQTPATESVTLGIPGDNAYDEAGIRFLTWAETK